MIVSTSGRGRLLSEVNFVLFQHDTSCWDPCSKVAPGCILMMNVIYFLESAADSFIQWGAVGE